MPDGEGLLMPQLVFARPERLQQFRTTAGALAAGLAARTNRLDAAVADYRLHTESAFEVPCSELVDALRHLRAALDELGEWVGQVGDAFDGLPSFDGIAFCRTEFLGLLPAVSLPGDRGGRYADLLELAEDLAVGALGGIRDGATAAADDVAVGVARGAAGLAQRAAAAAARNPIFTASQLLSYVSAAQQGIAELRHRWHAEADRPTPERAARAALDGALNTAGTIGGGGAGGWLGNLACGPPCAPILAAAGSELGRRGGELAGDLLLGEERPEWQRDPLLLADEISDVDVGAIVALQPSLDGVAADAEALADRHADFVIDHPWVWADTYGDAPVVPSPPPAPDVPTRGLR